MRRILAVFLFLAAASSTSVVPRTVEELTRESSLVVVGTAQQPRAVWNRAHTMIYTLTPVRVERAWKGAPVPTVTVVQMGGALDGLQMKVAGVKAIRENERSALFLHPSVDMPGAYAITGLMQGNFRIDNMNGTEVVSNGARGVELLDRDSQLREYTGSVMTLKQLEARVRKAVQR